MPNALMLILANVLKLLVSSSAEPVEAVARRLSSDWKSTVPPGVAPASTTLEVFAVTVRFVAPEPRMELSGLVALAKIK